MNPLALTIATLAALIGIGVAYYLLRYSRR